jgi:penicillin-binding protein 1A
MVRNRADTRRKTFHIKRIAAWLLGLVAAGFLALCVIVGIAVYYLPNYQELKSQQNGQTIRVHGDDGNIIITLGVNTGDWLNYDDIPPLMVDAMTSIEDRRFFYHPGVDPIGVLRSLFHNTSQGAYSQGGSTLTQQLARNIFLTNEKKFSRKLREMVLALAMERKYNKHIILEAYLNKVYFGGGAYGIDAASKRFFGHAATHLNLAESAIIAGLVKAPSSYSPTTDSKAAIARAQFVLQAMVSSGKITQAQADAVDFSAIKIQDNAVQTSARYFTDWALPQLEQLGIDNKTDSLDIWTTIDPEMQRAADASIKANVPSGTQGALVTLDSDGSVRAMVGGSDYITSSYNRATQAQRQAGSSFKLFVYLTALEAGHKPSDMVSREAVEINGWSPKNDDENYTGQVDYRTAFAQSINTSAAHIGQEQGFATIATMAKRFGLTTRVDSNPAMVLGSNNVRLIEMAAAYASVSNHGVAVMPYGIVKVTTGNGQLLYQHHVDTSHVLVSPQVTNDMTELMQAVITSGTGRAAAIGRPAAGKTGTTSNNADGWFLGFSSGLTTGVWMGRDDNRPVRALWGGTAPARAFAGFMRVAVAKRPVEIYQTNAPLPTWQSEPDTQTYFGQDNVPPIDDGDAGGAPVRTPKFDNRH